MNAMEEINKLEQDLKQSLEEIYSIKCTNECIKCKEHYGNIKYCPKSYADDIAEGISMIKKSLPIVEDILRIRSENNA